jgi:ABC-2 type transport system permease protein
MTLTEVLTYTLIAEAFAKVLACRSELPYSLSDGSVAVRLLQPVGMVGSFAAAMIGRWGFGFLFFSLPLLAAAPLLGVSPLPASAAAGALFLASLLLAVTVGLAIDFFFGALMVLMEQDYWSIHYVRAGVTGLLSGAVIPLALLPWGLGEIFSWLPFAALASAPLRIFTGTGAPLPLLAGQALWALLLWPLTGLLWRANRERLVCYGG